MGNQILSTEQLASLEKYQGDKKIAKGVEMMRENFGNYIRELSDDKLAMSYYGSFNAMGRNAKNTADL